MAIFALIQSNFIENAIADNHQILANHIYSASQTGATIMVLPEMFNTGFPPPGATLAEKANKDGVDFLLEQAQKYKVTLIGSLPNPFKNRGSQDKDSLPYNTVYVVNQLGIAASYSKIHLFSFGGENQNYIAGDRPTTTLIDGLEVSLFICYDLRFPSIFFDLATKTHVYIVVANWPSSRHLHWETLLRARAIENLAYVVGVNRVGSCGKLSYQGGSQVIAPFGEIIAHAGSEEGVVLANVNAEVVKQTRDKFPFFADRKKILV